MTRSKQTSLVTKAQAAFEDPALLGLKHPLVLMVSGGSDSVALLRLAVLLCAEAKTPLTVLHVNHLLRAEEAEADQLFVELLCAHLGVTCNVERVDVAALAATSSESVEQVGRSVRYALAEQVLARFTAEVGCGPELGRIVTAHTADDRAETLLQRLIVGGGGGSLGSIRQRNGQVVRPLLDCTRKELQDWLRAQGERIDGCLWREDATNLDTRYSRAFVRHEVLPLLATRNPRIIEGLNRTAEVLAEESAWLDKQAAELLPLSGDSFLAPLPVLRRAVYLACTQAIAELAPSARITFDHVDLIVREGNRPGFACQIPGGIEVRRKKNTFVFSKAKPPKHDPRT